MLKRPAATRLRRSTRTTQWRQTASSGSRQPVVEENASGVSAPVADHTGARKKHISTMFSPSRNSVGPNSFGSVVREGMGVRYNAQPSPCGKRYRATGQRSLAKSVAKSSAMALLAEGNQVYCLLSKYICAEGTPNSGDQGVLRGQTQGCYITEITPVFRVLEMDN